MAPVIHQSDACHFSLATFFSKNNSATLTNSSSLRKQYSEATGFNSQQNFQQNFRDRFFCSKVVGYWSWLETLLLRLRHYFFEKNSLKFSEQLFRKVAPDSLILVELRFKISMDIYGTKYSRMDRVKFVEDSL